MTYNAIQMRLKIDNLIDRVKSPRITDDRYYSAINEAIMMTLNDRTENIKRRKSYSVQSSQRLRNELYTIVPPTLTATLAGTLVSFPADYYYLLEMQATVDGETNVVRPLTFNSEGLIERNPFQRPKAYKTYFNENASGWEIKIPSGSTLSSVQLDYIRNPATVSIGTDSNKINPGAVVLTIGTTYYVYRTAVHGGVTYYDGQTFVATGTALNAGIVIPSSAVVNCDLPGNIQDEVIRLAAAIVDGSVENYRAKQDLKQDNAET